jgi:hypothetical protein
MMTLRRADACAAPATQLSLRSVSPLDDGNDAAELARSLLLSAPQLPGVRLQTASFDDEIEWQGQLAPSVSQGAAIGLRGTGLELQVVPEHTYAVSRCCGDGVAGIRLYGGLGQSLTLIWTETAEFESWLGANLRHPD